MHLHKVLFPLQFVYGENLIKEVHVWQEGQEYFTMPRSVPGVYQAHLFDGLTLIGKSADFPYTLIHLIDDRNFPCWQVDFYECRDWKTAELCEKAGIAAIEGRYLDFD